MFKLLILDDERHVRQAIKLLGKWDILKIDEIFEAAEGESALKIMREKYIDIVLVDIKMPKMNGMEFLQIAKKEFQNTKFIIISGYDDFEFTKNAIKIKVFDYILKPVAENELNEAILKGVLELEQRKTKSMQYLNKKREDLHDAFINGNVYSVKKRIFECFEYYNDTDMNLNDYIEMVQYFKLEFKNCVLEIYGQVIEGSIDKFFENFGSLVIKEDSDFAYIFNYLLSMATEMLKYFNSSFKNIENENLYEIRQYIDEFYYKDINLNTFSKKYYLSKDYLSKLFKEQFGSSIYEYVLQVRMIKAKEYLSDLEIKISAVSENLGYKDNNYFSKAFKNYYGISPSEFREKSI